MLSLCTIARDEEQFLAGLLGSVRDVVDEVVLGIDRRTTDDTIEIARLYGARLFVFDWADSFAAARNLTIDRARGDWVLVLDPDERLLPEGRRVLREFLAHLDEVALAIDGFHTLIVETDLEGNELGPPERSSSRLFRNSPDLRYMGRVHEEIRYLPNPPNTVCAMLEGGPHIQHYGLDPSVWAAREKARRDTRLLLMRLEDNPNDAVALCYLALMARKDGQLAEAIVLAKQALKCGPRTLHEDRRAQLEALVTLGQTQDSPATLGTSGAMAPKGVGASDAIQF
jgi:glycosyltransferase involved in cell wall biosynthesis